MTSPKQSNPLSPTVTEEEIQQSEQDDFGVHYSDDGHRLLRFPEDAGNHLREYAVPEGVTVICDNAFEGCEGLRTVRLPRSLRVIGNLAFDSCERLERLDLPEGLLAIGKNVWANCERLTLIAIPSTVRIIGANPFYRSAVKTLMVASPRFAHSDGCLIDVEEKRLISVFDTPEEFITPAGLEIIGEDAFHELRRMKRLIVSEGVRELHRFAVVGCPSLQSVTLPPSVGYLSPSAFSFCINLHDVTIPRSVSPDIVKPLSEAIKTEAGSGARVVRT